MPKPSVDIGVMIVRLGGRSTSGGIVALWSLFEEMQSLLENMDVNS